MVMLNSTEQPRAMPEPPPEWEEAKKVWGVAWPLHWIMFGCLFFLLGTFSVLSMLSFRKSPTVMNKRYFYTVNTLLVCFAYSEALYLWIDPYESSNNIDPPRPFWFGRILTSLPYPSLIAAFGIIQKALIDVTRVKMLSTKAYGLRWLLTLVAIHFSLSLISVVGWTISDRFAPLVIACQFFFFVWGLVLCVGFFYSGWKISRALAESKRTLSAEASSSSRRKLKKVVRVISCTAVLGVVLCALQLFSLFGVYKPYPSTAPPNPWLWWSLQTCLRATELSMGCTIAYSLTQRHRKTQNAVQVATDNKLVGTAAEQPRTQ